MSKTELFTEEPLFEKCKCYGHLFELQRYKDIYDGYVDEGFNLSIWKLSCLSNKMSWRERLRWIWKILKTGNLWADEIILTNEQAKEVVEYINKYLPKE